MNTCWIIKLKVMKSQCCHSKRIQPADQETLICMNNECSNYLLPTRPAANGPKTWNNLFIAFFLVFFLIFSFDDFSSIDRNSGLYNDLKRINERSNMPLSSENLRNEIEKQGVLCPEQVHAQILLESGNLHSFLTRRTNNLLGMRYPFKRKTTAIGIYLPERKIIVKGDQLALLKYRGENHYAVYSSWQDCVADYKLWQDQCFKLTDRYLSFLGTYYAEDENYIAKIKSMTRK